MDGAWGENKFNAFLKLAHYHQMKKQYSQAILQTGPIGFIKT